MHAQHALQRPLDVAMRRVPGQIVEAVHLAQCGEPPADRGRGMAAGEAREVGANGGGAAGHRSRIAAWPKPKRQSPSRADRVDAASFSDWIRCRTDVPAGSCYRDVMQIYIFVSDLRTSIRAFTADTTGGNLPAEYAPWHAVNGGRAMAAGSHQDPVVRAIARDGFFLVTTKDQAETRAQKSDRSVAPRCPAGGH
jgi:hypothetical protein